jgi:hypothetical protein
MRLADERTGGRTAYPAELLQRPAIRRFFPVLFLTGGTAVGDYLR